MNHRSARLCAALALMLSLFLHPFSTMAADVLIPAHSVWKYLPITNDVGTAWREFDYDDRPWAQGPAQLGYGDQDELTVVPFFFFQMGLKDISTYFRRSFTATNSARYTNLLVRLLRDDAVQREQVRGDGIRFIRRQRMRRHVRHCAPNVIEYRRRIRPVAAHGADRRGLAHRALTADEHVVRPPRAIHTMASQALRVVHRLARGRGTGARR